MSDASTTETTTERPTVRVPFALLAVGFVSLALLAILVGSQIWTTYSKALPKSLLHVPNDSSYAARIVLPNPQLQAAIEPVLQSLNTPRKAGQAPRRERLADRLGHDVVASIGELSVARGPKDDDFLITASGGIPERGLLEAIAAVLSEEGWTWTLDAARGTLVSPEGIAIGLASDGTVILSSGLSRLIRAQKRDTGEPSRSVARGVFPEQDELTRISAELAKRLKASSEPVGRPVP